MKFCAVLVGALNDRLLLANPTEINPRQKKGVEIKSCLVGLLEPLLIGFATMQERFEQKLDLSEIMYQITSRFSSNQSMHMPVMCGPSFLDTNFRIYCLFHLFYLTNMESCMKGNGMTDISIYF